MSGLFGKNRGARHLAVGLMALGGVALAASAAMADPVTLGDAAQYGLLIVPGGDVTMNGPSVINGDIGLGQGAQYTFTSPSTISGTVFTDSGVSGTSNLNPMPSFVGTDLSAAIGAAQTASTQAASLAPTQTFGTIGNNATIAATQPGQNVIQTAGVNITSGALTFTNPNNYANVSFIVNSSGGFKLSNGQVLTAAGVTPSQLLFNLTGGNLTITGGGPGTIDGNFIDLAGAVSIHDDTQLGDLVAKDVTITSGYKIEGGHGFCAGTSCASPPPSCTGSGCPVPEPPTLPILGMGLIGAWLVSRRIQRGAPK